MAFLEEEEILPLKDYMDLALRERIGSFSPISSDDELRGFFSEVGYRDEMAMRTSPLPLDRSCPHERRAYGLPHS